MFRGYVHFFFAFIMPAAFALAQQEPSTTVGGYGELHYNEPDGSRRGQIDFHRFVLYVGHAFSEKISFRSELEIEHTKVEAGSSEGGEVALEQAYLEFRLAEAFGVRAGILLAPVGLTNLYHEPPVFNGVERPAIDRAVIPTTWREAGAGIFGAPLDGFRYQLYLTAGLKASGFDAANGIRGGRQEGFESDPVNPSLCGRVDYSPLAGLETGASFFAGNAGGGEDSVGSVPVTVLSADVRYAQDLLSLRGVAAMVTIGNASQVNARFGNAVANRIYGVSLEAAYNVLPLLIPGTEEDLSLFLRWERYDTQASTPGFTPFLQYRRTDTQLGLTYKPLYNVVIKADYGWQQNALNAGAAVNTGQLNVGLGYYFF